jgi:hypothetical protein
MLLIFALLMTIFLNKDVNSLNKKDEDSFLYYFFKKYACLYIPTDAGYIDGKGAYMWFFLFQIFFAIFIPNITAAFEMSIYYSNTIYFI